MNGEMAVWRLRHTNAVWSRPPIRNPDEYELLRAFPEPGATALVELYEALDHHMQVPCGQLAAFNASWWRVANAHRALHLLMRREAVEP